MPSSPQKTITPEIMTIDQIEVSPLNVRRHRATIEAIGAMQASILGRGLIQPLNVHPMRGSKKFGAFAGGRRARAIRALVDAGKLPADWPVRVEVYLGHSDVEIIELSLGENIERAQLELYEICAAIRALDARNETVQSIATAIGQPEDIVARWRRVGRLDEPVFEAFASGLITTDQARAFAATEDRELQRVTFEQLRGNMPSPADIRRAMKIGDRRAQADLSFVGVETYRQAGGRFELDLFADETEERGRIVDEGILQRLVQDKRETILAEVRATTGRPELRFIAETPKDQWRSEDHQLAVSPKRRDDGGLELPDNSDVVAHLAIDSAGEPVISYWWESRKAKFGSERKPAADAPATTPPPPAAESPFAGRQRADAAHAENDGLSKDGLFALRAVRKTLLRAALIDDARDHGDAGQDYLIWSQARMLLAVTAGARFGLRPIGGEMATGVSNEAFGLARDQIAATRAARVAGDAIAELKRQSFFTAEDPRDAFLDFRMADAEMKLLTAAVVAGLALERGVAGEIALHDTVAEEAGMGSDEDVRSFWSPTADFLDLFPKEQRLGFAEPYVDHATFLTWAKLKSSDLTSNVLAVLTRAGSAGVSWVHPLLRFRTTQSQDVREAAE